MAGVAHHQKSTLPSPTSLAHAIRYDGQTCTSLARELGCSDKRISDHLHAGGFDGRGDPIEHSTGPRPRLKDSDTGSANFVSGGDRPLSTDPVQYGRAPSHAREGLDWGDLGPPPKPPPWKREVFPEPDPDAYVEPPTLGEEWDPDAQSTVHEEDQDLAELEETAAAPQMRPDEHGISHVELRNNVSSDPSDDSHLTGSGKTPGKIEQPTPDVDPHTPRVDGTDSEAADAPQMRPVDTNEGSNDDPNAAPEPEQPASAASRAKSTGHTHGNGGTCHSLHARQFDATAALLLRAKQSDRKRIQALGERINDLLIDLRDRLDDEDQARRERAEAQRRREEAKAEVKRLENELRDAKARARRHNKGYSRTPDVQARTPDVPGDNSESREQLDARTKALDQSRDHQRELLARYGVRLGEVRAWALEQGIDCPAKGSRLPRSVLDAYEAAQTGEAS